PPEHPGCPQGSRDPRSHFIYPYNFVPHGGPRRTGSSPAISQDRKFKPLHRYDGLTGRIEYTLTSLSPIFIPDPEGVTIYKIGDRDEDIHKVKDFFNVDGRLCISPTSTKGMIRSVVEAATNSSFGVSSEYKHPTLRRLPRPSKCLVVQQEGRNDGSGWKFVEASTAKINMNMCQDIDNGTKIKFQAVKRGKAYIVQWIKCNGQERGERVTSLHLSGDGWLYNPIEAIDRQRWFHVVYFEVTSGKASTDYRYGKQFSVPPKVVQDYFIAYPEYPLRESSIVFWIDHMNKSSIGRVQIHRVAENENIKSLLESVGQYHYPQSADCLCPATRLFGWTPEEKEETEEEGEQGIAGRVSFSVAWSEKTLKDTHPVPLKVLGSPKPQYYPFYLRPDPSQNKDPSTNVAYYTKAPHSLWAATPGTIRGRKFYLHHPKAMTEEALEYIKRKEEELSPDKIETEEEERWKNIYTHQNTTCAVLAKGAVFKGTIDFESLDDYELGMLLWALTISDDPLNESQEYAHKLGMGKGIGLGSVRFHIEEVIFTQPEKDWTGDLESLNERPATPEEVKNFVRKFKTWMLTGKSEDNEVEASKYDDLQFVKDLKALLQLDFVGLNIPVQYYPPYWEKDGRIGELHADEAFDYFMDQRRKRSQESEEPLRTPNAIRKGWKQGII
ncbi:hypothetical protein HKBW3S44_01173, partial [Candidatus Hakubella thermalkaliphila]